MTKAKEWEIALQLLGQQSFSVLGTSRHGHAYTSLVAFSATESGDKLYFTTTRSTRKYHNLSADNRVSLLIDNRSDLDNPLYEAAAVTAYGTAEELDGESRQQALANFLLKHPQMKAFTTAPTTALFQVDVTEYHLVQRFQNVTEFVMKK